MKKRVLLFLLSVLLLQGGFALPAKAEDAPVAIDSREGMEAIAQNPAGNYCITADIDMDGTPWTPIPFAGTLDGQGHTLYNLRVREPGAEVVGTFDGNRKTYDTVFGALFSTVTDATVKKRCRERMAEAMRLRPNRTAFWRRWRAMRSAPRLKTAAPLRA